MCIGGWLCVCASTYVCFAPTQYCNRKAEYNVFKPLSIYHRPTLHTCGENVCTHAPGSYETPITYEFSIGKSDFCVMKHFILGFSELSFSLCFSQWQMYTVVGGSLNAREHSLLNDSRFSWHCCSPKSVCIDSVFSLF